MKLRNGSEAYDSGHGNDEGTSSKRRRSSEEGEAEGSDAKASRLRKVDEGEELAEMDTSLRSDYMKERSEGGGSGSGSESLETESKYSTECVGTGSREVSNTNRGKRRSVIPNVEAVWRSIEEESLMDSSAVTLRVELIMEGKVVQMCHWWRNQ